MRDGYLNYSEFRNQFFDKFGNRKNNYIIEKYCKSTNGWILEETIKTYNGCYYVVNNKCYFECNNSLIPLNMDFESKDCGAVYKIVGKDITKYRKIIGNEYLCTNEYLGLKLHRQDYSDGTCFYTLQDKFGEFRVNHGNKNLEELINVLEKTLIRLQSFPNHPVLNQFIEIFNYEEILMVLLHNADMSRNKRWRMK